MVIAVFDVGVPRVPFPLAGNPMDKGIFRPFGGIFVWGPLGRAVGELTRDPGGGTGDKHPPRAQATPDAWRRR